MVDIQNRDNEFGFPRRTDEILQEDSRYPPLCTQREATSGKNLNEILVLRKKKPEIQVQMLKFDSVPEYYDRSHNIEIMLLPGGNLCSEGRFSHTSELH